MVFTLLMEGLRPLLHFVGISQEWRLAVAPLFLILLMIFRPQGIMGGREFWFFIPKEELPKPSFSSAAAGKTYETMEATR